MNERQTKILNIMRLQPYMTFKDLAAQLSVSSMTIRRDLAKLEKDSSLQGVGGGIVNAAYLNVDIRLQQNAEAKRRIAARLVQYISPGQCVFLDAGSTVHYCLESMSMVRGLTTITYDVKHTTLLNNMGTSRHYLIGGEFHPDMNTSAGPLAETFLRQFQADVAIIGCSGLSDNGDMACNIAIESPLKQIMLTQAKRRILVTDASKFSRHAMLVFGHVRDLDMIITDAPPLAALARTLKRQGVAVIIASHSTTVAR